MKSQPEATGHSADAPPVAPSGASLADLMQLVNDESQDIRIRFEAAKAALLAKDRDALTVNVVSYADAQVFERPTPLPAHSRMGRVEQSPVKSRFYSDSFLLHLRVNPAAIECADQVMATIKQESRDKADFDRLVEGIRAGLATTLEDMLGLLDKQ